MGQGIKEKERSVQKEVDQLFQTWMFRVCIIGSLLFLSLSFLDYYSTPENFRTFLRYRIVISALLALTAVPLKFVKNRHVIYGITILAVAASAATIEMMILRFGGHASSYYAGQILLIVCISGILPASTGFVTFVTMLIYAVYLLPILIYDPLSDVRLFFTHNYFLIAVSASALILRHMGYKSMVERLSLQYDLRQHQLHLEEEIAERTIKYTTAISSLHDEIVQREQIEEALKKASDEWRTTFDSTLDAVFLLDSEMAVIKANAAAARMLGLPPAETYGKSICGLFRCSPDELDQSPLPEMQATMHRSEKEIYLSDRGIWIGAAADPIVDSTGRLSGAVLTVRDATDVKKLQDSILQAKMDWEDTFDTINDAITIHDSDFNIIRANRAAEEILRLPALTMSKQKCYVSYHGTGCPPDGCPSCLVLKNGEPSVTELFEPHLGKHIEIKALPRFDKDRQLRGLIHVVRDITERKRAEEEHQRLQTQFLQAQKMDSIGRFAGGIAHDLNNLLSAVIGYSELSLALKPGDKRHAEYMENIRNAGDKAAALTRQILAVSRKQVLEVKPLNVNVVIGQMETMIRRLIGEDIVVRFHPGGGLPNIMADASQLEQVILNLAVNARDAMPRGGSLTISTAEFVLNEPQGRDDHILPPGTYIMLSVSDTGTGIAPEIQEKIFEPFFTTKERGKGTGLGLATVYGIVKQHSGYIYIESEPGSGTTFRVYFPTTDTREAVRNQPGRQEGVPIGTETILIVDDDASIRKLARNILQELGYRLHEAGSAREAMDVSRSLQGSLHLLVTDVVMPDRNGRELAEILLQERPSTKVLFMSGYTDEIIARHGILESGAAFFQKPITRENLARKVRQVLDSEITGTVPATLLHAGNKLRILIVDDDETSFKLTELYVSVIAKVVAWAENGQAAVDLVRSNTYDLVIMDMVMPVMDGSTAVREIRAWERRSGRRPIPIIMLSGSIMPGDQQASIAAGGTASIVKPLNRDALLHLIDSCLERTKGSAAGEAAPNGHGRIWVKGDAALKELVPEYLTTRQADVALLQEALAQREFERIRIIGHSMKGSGGGYGFDEISAIGREIEHAAKSEQSEAISALIGRLDDYLKRVEVAYE